MHVIFQRMIKQRNIKLSHLKDDLGTLLSEIAYLGMGLGMYQRRRKGRREDRKTKIHHAFLWLPCFLIDEVVKNKNVSAVNRYAGVSNNRKGVWLEVFFTPLVREVRQERTKVGVPNKKAVVHGNPDKTQISARRMLADDLFSPCRIFMSCLSFFVHFEI